MVISFECCQQEHQNRRGTRDHLERGNEDDQRKTLKEWLKTEMNGICLVCLTAQGGSKNFEAVPYLKFSFVLRVALVISYKINFINSDHKLILKYIYFNSLLY